jgi:hypothetical protein
MAHTGIYWHEAADQAAGWLASGESTADVTYDSPSNSKSGMHWPHQVTKKQNNTRHGIACATPIAGVGGTLKNFVCQHNKDGPEEVMLVMITGVRSLTCCITSYPNQLAVYLLFFFIRTTSLSHSRWPMRYLASFSGNAIGSSVSRGGLSRYATASMAAARIQARPICSGLQKGLSSGTSSNDVSRSTDQQLLGSVSKLDVPSAAGLFNTHKDRYHWCAGI